jgi:hypothetical protein
LKKELIDSTLMKKLFNKKNKSGIIPLYQIEINDGEIANYYFKDKTFFRTKIDFKTVNDIVKFEKLFEISSKTKLSQKRI